MNEKGFTLIETLLAFSIIILVISTVIPLFFQLNFTISDKKNELTATRLLSEFVLMTEEDGKRKEAIQMSRGIKYELRLEYDDKDELYACVQYEEKKKCIQ